MSRGLFGAVGVLVVILIVGSYLVAEPPRRVPQRPVVDGGIAHVASTTPHPLSTSLGDTPVSASVAPGAPGREQPSSSPPATASDALIGSREPADQAQPWPRLDFAPEVADKLPMQSAAECIPIVRNVSAYVTEDNFAPSAVEAVNNCSFRYSGMMLTRTANPNKMAASRASFKAFALRHPRSTSPASYRNVSAAVVFPLVTCFSNMWHGTVEVLLPLMHTMMAIGVPPPIPPHQHMNLSMLHNFTPGAPLLVVELMKGRKGFWGGKGCPPLHNHPFGFIGKSPRTPTAWMLAKMVSGIRFVEPRKRPLQPTDVSHNAHDPWTGIVDIGTLALGASRRCGTYLGLHKAPFFDVEGSGTGYSNVCTPVQRRLRQTLAAWLPPRREDPAFVGSFGTEPARTPGGSAVAAAPAEGPTGVRVVYWDRTDLKKNGRMVLNAHVLVDSLRAVCERSHGVSGAVPPCTFVHVLSEDLSFEQQLQLVADTDVLILPRGAGSVYAGLMPPNKGYLTFFPNRNGTAISNVGDNQPWWPLPLLRNDMSFRSQPCTAVGTNVNCVKRSVNFCDMVCATGVAQRLLEEMVVEVAAGSVTNRMPPVDCEQGKPDRCVYVDAG